MKFSILVLASTLTAALLMAGDGKPTVTFVDHQKVAEALMKGAGLASGPDYSVSALRRDKSGAAELHETQTDVYYVTEGDATFVTGGKLTGEKVVSPGQRQGTGVEGGEVHHLTQGDVVVIPAGVPHWFKAVAKPTSYLLIKVIKP